MFPVTSKLPSSDCSHLSNWTAAVLYQHLQMHMVSVDCYILKSLSLEHCHQVLNITYFGWGVPCYGGGLQKFVQGDQEEEID